MKRIIPDKFEEKILSLLLVAMTVILGVQVIARYIAGSSLTWSEELVRYLFIWSAFIGIPYCIKNGNSLKIIQFLNYIPFNMKKSIVFFNKTVTMLFFVWMTVSGFYITYNSYIGGQKSPALGLPMWIVYISVGLGALLSVIRLAESIWLLSESDKTEY